MMLLVYHARDIRGLSLGLFGENVRREEDPPSIEV